jgi:hypothetical protein
MPNELKPCPHCGWEVRMGRPNMHGLTRVICPNPDCLAEGGWMKPEKAVAAWNRRTKEGA